MPRHHERAPRAPLPPRSAPPLLPTGRPRSAFSIAEVLVALVLLGVGLLGMAGSSALAVRASAGAGRERRAVQRGADRLAHLGARGCAAATGGVHDDSASQLYQRWTVAPAAEGAAVRVDVETRWAAPRGTRSVRLRGALLC